VLFLKCWLAARLPQLPRMRGQGMVEYALILVLVAIVVVAVLVTMGNTIAHVFSNITQCLGDKNVCPK
jgi:pilus assembly protein Flp/PilA